MRRLRLVRRDLLHQHIARARARGLDGPRLGQHLAVDGHHGGARVRQRAERQRRGRRVQEARPARQPVREVRVQEARQDERQRQGGVGRREHAGELPDQYRRGRLEKPRDHEEGEARAEARRAREDRDAGRLERAEGWGRGTRHRGG